MLRGKIHPGIVSPEMFDVVKRDISRRDDEGRYHSCANCFSGKMISGCYGLAYGSKVQVSCIPTETGIVCRKLRGKEGMEEIRNLFHEAGLLIEPGSADPRHMGWNQQRNAP